MNNKNLWIGIVIVVVVLLGGFLLLNKNSSTPAAPTQNVTSQNQTTNKTAEKPKEVDVTVTADGFNPDTITINAGDKVVWKNESGTTVTVNSDLHPTHLLWPFLNLGAFDNGSSVSVVFDKAGTYTYHNHLNASQKGTVVVN